MGRRNEISNLDNVIDSRDVESRIEELEEERDALQETLNEAAALDSYPPEGATDDDLAEYARAATAAQDARDDWEAAYGDELRALVKLRDEAVDYCPDWRYGATLIHETHFVDYCREYVFDIGGIPKDLPDYLVIDWEATADNLRVDYTEIDFDGQTYLVR